MCCAAAKTELTLVRLLGFGSSGDEFLFPTKIKVLDATVNIEAFIVVQIDLHLFNLIAAQVKNFAYLYSRSVAEHAGLTKDGSLHHSPHCYLNYYFFTYRPLGK